MQEFQARSSQEHHVRFSSPVENLPRFLDIKGTQLLLIGAADNLSYEHAEAAAELEQRAQPEMMIAEQKGPDVKVREDIQLGDEISLQPLVDQQWS